MVDITIRGAGIFGLSTAWVCARRGALVRVIDPFGPGAGSSGGVVGALAPHVPENWNAKKAFQLESLLMAEAFWNSVVDAGGVSCGYRRSGRLQPIADARGLDLAQQREATARALWGANATWQVEPMHDDTWSPRSPSGWVIRDTLSALVHPQQSIDSLVAALSSCGVTVAAEGPDEGKVLWATGVSGLQDMNAEHHRMVGTGIKGQAAVLDHNAAGAPQLFVEGVHIIPHLNGTVAIGSTSERDFADGTKTDDLLLPIIAKARAAVPALKDAEVLNTWAGVRPRARSRAPMLGHWPDRPDHFIANGGFKIGFGMAPKIAEVMADLILEGNSLIPDGFDVSASF